MSVTLHRPDSRIPDASLTPFTPQRHHETCFLAPNNDSVRKNLNLTTWIVSSMKLVANRVNSIHLRDVLPSAADEVEGVLAAVAYGASGGNEKDDFLSHCVKNKYRLDIWMRYDHTVPVAVPLLERLLRNHNNNIFCRLVPDYLHSKLIWWKGYGAYIGSANLTDRAWLTNIEAGVFLDESDLEESGIVLEIESFFEWLKNLDKAFPLTQEIIEEMNKLELLRRGDEGKGKDKRKVPVWNGPSFESKKNAHEREKEKFRQEWHETLTTLRNIGEKLSNNRPGWVEEDVPLGWQIDQFLHAYYQNKVGDRKKKPYEEYYSKNRVNPTAASNAAVDWWKNTESPPSHEDVTFYKSAPYIKRKLTEDNILNLSEDEFSEICCYTHATKDHAMKISLATLGRPELSSLEIEERIPLFAAWLLAQRNKEGWDVRKLLHYVLYEGDDSTMWERLYNAGRTDRFRLPHYGLNSLAEVAGWARPEVAPPRNGRTSKALRALGYDVRVY